eukprot:IDg9426t1
MKDNGSWVFLRCLKVGSGVEQGSFRGGSLYREALSGLVLQFCLPVCQSTNNATQEERESNLERNLRKVSTMEQNLGASEQTRKVQDVQEVASPLEKISDASGTRLRQSRVFPI